MQLAATRGHEGVRKVDYCNCPGNRKLCGTQWEARAEEPEIELELPDIDPARIPKPKMPRILKGQLMTSAGTALLVVRDSSSLCRRGYTTLLAPSVGYFIADVEVALLRG